MRHHYYISTLLLAVLTVNAAKIPDPRINNGEIAERGQFPWQAFILYGEWIIPNIPIPPPVSQYCGGAIINEEWILTAAHCVPGDGDASVVYGFLNLASGDALSQSVQRVVLHEEFDAETSANDIALLQLTNPITFNATISPIALAEEELQPNTTVTVSGYGVNYADDTMLILSFVNVTTIENAQCAAVYGNTVITESVVCTEAGNPVKSPCELDSGDPVVVQGDDGPVLVALFSFFSANGCRDGNPAGYTRTAYYRDWIKNITGV